MDYYQLAASLAAQVPFKMTQNAAFCLFVCLYVSLSFCFLLSLCLAVPLSFSVCWQVFSVFAEYHSQINGGHLGGSNSSSSSSFWLLESCQQQLLLLLHLGCIRAAHWIHTHTHRQRDCLNADKTVACWDSSKETHTNTQGKFKNARQDKHCAASLVGTVPIYHFTLLLWIR